MNLVGCGRQRRTPQATGDIRRWTVMPRGRHFAPAEEPELVAHDITAFLATLS